MESHDNFFNQNENELYMNDGDAIDQNWSNPKGANPEWNANGSTKVYNNEFINNSNNCMHHEETQLNTKNEDNFYFQNEDTPQDHENTQFDDAYYYDQDYQY